VEWTNYHHLLYFYTAVKEGGVSKAAQVLHVSQPTVSKLIATLVDQLGDPLWIKEGRRFKLTESGEIVYQYAEEIFALGAEMRETLKGGTNQKNKRFTLGINQALPKLLAARIITPLMKSVKDIQLICIEDSLERLREAMQEHKIDVILSDAAAPMTLNNKGYNHLMIESQIGLYGSPAIQKKSNKPFPQNLNDIPVIVPTRPSALRVAFENWCLSHEVNLNIVAECDDSGLAKALGAEGLGAFVAPLIVDKEITSQYKVIQLGVFSEIKEKIWLISPMRKISHPVVKAFLKLNKTNLKNK